MADDSYVKLKCLARIALNKAKQTSPLLYSSSVLLWGPSGVGKSTVVKNVLSSLNVSVFHIGMMELSNCCFSGDTASALSERWHTALRSVPTVIVFDHLDAIFPAGVADSSVLQTIIRATVLFRSIQRMPVFVIGITSSLSTVSMLVRDLFDDKILVSGPSFQERIDMIHSVSNNDGVCIDPKCEIAALAKLCHSSSRGEIATICQIAAGFSSMGSASSHGITHLHFLMALQQLNINSKHAIFPPNGASCLPDLAGLDKQKRDLIALLVWPFQKWQLFERVRMPMPRGILICGPPGTGKTSLAQWIIHQSPTKCLTLSLTDLVKSEVGESEKQVRRIFERARFSSPCILFCDNVDAIFGTSSASGQIDRQILSQLLLEMDNTIDSTVILFGTTSYRELVDPSLLSRFDVLINTSLPSIEERCAILEIIATRMKLFQGSLNELANLTDGFSGADLHSVCNSAGILALASDPKTTEIDKSFCIQAIKDMSKRTTET